MLRERRSTDDWRFEHLHRRCERLRGAGAGGWSCAAGRTRDALQARHNRTEEAFRRRLERGRRVGIIRVERTAVQNLVERVLADEGRLHVRWRQAARRAVQSSHAEQAVLRRGVDHRVLAGRHAVRGCSVAERRRGAGGEIAEIVETGDDEWVGGCRVVVEAIEAAEYVGLAQELREHRVRLERRGRDVAGGQRREFRERRLLSGGHAAGQQLLGGARERQVREQVVHSILSGLMPCGRQTARHRERERTREENGGRCRAARVGHTGESGPAIAQECSARAKLQVHSLSLSCARCSNRRRQRGGRRGGRGG